MLQALLKAILTQLFILVWFRVCGLVIYPIAYMLRYWLRRSYAETYHKQYYIRHRFRWLWYFLDDSIHIDSAKHLTYERVDYNVTPNGSGSQKHTGQSFWKSYLWSQLRNTGVNHRNYILKGMCLNPPADKNNYCGVFKMADDTEVFSIKKIYYIGNKAIKVRWGHSLGDSPIDGRFEDITIRRDKKYDIR